MDRWDYLRFFETIQFYYRAPQPVKLSDFRRGVIKLKQIDNQIELVRIFCYCLMPNHFHFLIQQLVEQGITGFMKKLSNSYTKYFNTKYKRIGPLLQGTFKAKLIETDEYLLQLSKYIHRNTFLLKRWERRLYPYSSYGYYLSQEKHPFCNTEFISSYFSKINPNLTYKSFVQEDEIDNRTILDMAYDSSDCVPRSHMEGGKVRA